MFRLLIALPLIATFTLSIPFFHASTPTEQDTGTVSMKSGFEADPSG